MNQRRLLWQIFPLYLLVTLLVLAAAGWLASYEIRSLHSADLASDLSARAALFERLLPQALSAESEPAVDRLCKQVGRDIATRFTVILADGRVLGDTDEDPAQMANHSGRPEMLQALQGQIGVARRYSDTRRMSMLYAALPLYEQGRINAVVRASMPEATIVAVLRTFYQRLAVGGLALALLSTLIIYLWARRIAGPLERLRLAAEALSAGRLEHRVHVAGSLEARRMAEAFNLMAEQLDERIRTISSQAQELQAVLSSMVESVLAVDADQRLIRCNHAAAALLHIDPLKDQGKLIQELVRHAGLHKLVADSLERSGTVSAELVFEDNGERWLEAQGTKLDGIAGGPPGALIVLHDITRLKALERIRSEFVANVSHELKTPVTSISGFVETLRDGALQDPERSQRFLEIMSQQVERLTAILDDLLSLSSIEQEADRDQLALGEQQLKELVLSATTVCGHKAASRRIRIEIDCPNELKARANAALLEQALINLIDNAIKYSDEGSLVQVRCRQRAAELAVEVIDQGIGIPAEHLPRIFERFYRVDKSRSRKLGGTGLGLAIAKHIVNAHHGSIQVRSTPGQGSTFTILLPLMRG